MTTPVIYHNPAQETRDLEDEKVADAYEKSHDADIPSEQRHYAAPGAEKEANSAAISTHSDERTLESGTAIETEQDPNIVDWDGPEDPANPQNWPASRKWGLIAILGMVTLVT